MPRREVHEVHRDTWWHWTKKQIVCGFMALSDLAFCATGGSNTLCNTGTHLLEYTVPRGECRPVDGGSAVHEICRRRHRSEYGGMDHHCSANCLSYVVLTCRAWQDIYCTIIIIIGSIPGRVKDIFQFYTPSDWLCTHFNMPPCRVQ